MLLALAERGSGSLQSRNVRFNRAEYSADAAKRGHLDDRIGTDTNKLA